MDVYSLKNYIINNPELIGLVLEKTGFHHIDDSFNHGLEYRCAREEGRNPTSVKVVKENLKATSFSTNFSGDLIYLVKEKLKISFPKAIKKVADIVNFKETEAIEYQLPFGGFYKNIMKLKSDEYLDIETYPESLLDEFELKPNMMFYQDGISEDVQYKYKIGYDVVTNRITVGWRSFSGELCGVMGRLNKREVEEYENKWFPIVPFPKSKTLYGFTENYNSIQEKGIAMVGESEKHTHQLDSKGLPVGLSLGGSFMSEVQANHIKSLFPDKVLVMMDQGLEEDHSREIAKQLKMDSYYKNSVGYIFDKSGLYLPDKYAPSDLAKSDLQNLIKNCTIWI